ncbi:hypothetical protein L2D00_11495 [Hyphomonadaceae bacterium BL14]|nr:hypothetical protein L2D00_11495 [Hyphomonadaceae bacterium BL14]
MTVLAILAIVVPAALGVGAALWLRARLKALSFTAWLGWTLLGTGLPVLAGQLGALALASGIERALEACEAGNASGACAGDPLPVVLALTAGLAGGLGWAAGAISTRLAPARG